MDAKIVKEEKKFSPITVEITLNNEEDLAFMYRMVALASPSTLNVKLGFDDNNTVPKVRNSNPVYYTLWPLLEGLVYRMGWKK